MKSFGEEEDSRPETYREDYFDMEASFLESAKYMEIQKQTPTALEQWLNTYAPQTVVEKFQPSY